MSDFLRDLLVGVAHADPYLWASVLWAHAMIGVTLMATIGALAARWLRDGWAGVAVVASLYAVWESVQFAAGAPAADCALDWSAVVIGAVLALSLWQRLTGRAAAAAGALISMSIAGVWTRARKEPGK